jgi:hypothetical protein
MAKDDGKHEGGLLATWMVASIFLGAVAWYAWHPLLALAWFVIGVAVMVYADG